jgi:type IV secretory pathway VirB2 component (pilin)
MFEHAEGGLWFVMKRKAIGLLVLALLAIPAPVQAIGYDNMPWEIPLGKIQQSLTGPVALMIALIGIFATGATLIWGGEMNEFGRRGALLALIVSVLVFASSLLSNAFGTGGALI